MSESVPIPNRSLMRSMRSAWAEPPAFIQGNWWPGGRSLDAVYCLTNRCGLKVRLHLAARWVRPYLRTAPTVLSHHAVAYEFHGCVPVGAARALSALSFSV